MVLMTRAAVLTYRATCKLPVQYPASRPFHASVVRAAKAKPRKSAIKAGKINNAAHPVAPKTSVQPEASEICEKLQGELQLAIEGASFRQNGFWSPTLRYTYLHQKLSRLTYLPRKG